MIDRVSRLPGRTVVAILANVGSLNMRRTLAGCIDAVMTPDAVIDDAGVIERGRCPCYCRVATVTVVAGRDVCRVLASGGDPIVAIDTGADYLQVIDIYGRLPHIYAVAVLADVGRRYVRDAFAGCRYTIVTADTVAEYSAVIESRWNPGNCQVAVVALVARLDMSQVLACCLDAVVTGNAAAGDCSMVHERYCAPGSRGVAILAVVGTEDMIYGFA